MFKRRLKSLLARCCVALICLQAVTAAYACPAFLGELRAPAMQEHHASAGAAMPGHCDEQPAGNTTDTSLCHEHYAGDQSVGGGALDVPAVALPAIIVALAEPASASGEIVLPVLLRQSTAPPLAIAFQVLRI
jgi:hypothetical protein